VETLPGKHFGAIVRSVGSQVDAATGTVPVLAAIQSATTALKDDMTISSTLTTSTVANAILVPKSALLTDPNTSAPSVVVVDAEDTAHLREVKVGQTSKDQVQILSGIKAGELVAVSGQYALPDGTKVTVKHGT
jgi:multidrug efflux pump subunit AcrA (membrane-fusion protein)